MVRNRAQPIGPGYFHHGSPAGMLEAEYRLEVG